MLMLCGLPGSGKSTYAKTKVSSGYSVYSSDDLRIEMFGDVNCQGNNEKLFTELHRRIKQALKNGKNIIYDATNINKKQRMHFIRQLKNIECYKECMIFPLPIGYCIDNNLSREKAVPISVIDKMVKTFAVPYYDEGFDIISIKEPEFASDVVDLCEFVNMMCEITLDNPNHDFTIGEHCLRTYQYIKENIKDREDLQWAALLHDCGKVYCKSFKDRNGNTTNIAHYYGHENVSAYISIQILLKYYATDDLLRIVHLINNHMRFMQIASMDSDAAKNAECKLIDKFGLDVVNDLYTLYVADKTSAKEVML